MLNSANFERGVNFDRAIQGDFEAFENLRTEPGVRDGHGINVRGEKCNLIVSVRVRDGLLADGQSVGGNTYFRTGNRQALTVRYGPLNG